MGQDDVDIEVIQIDGVKVGGVFDFVDFMDFITVITTAVAVSVGDDAVEVEVVQIDDA